MTAADLLTEIVYKWKKRKEHRKRQEAGGVFYFPFRAQIYCEQNDRWCCERAGVRYGKDWRVDLAVQFMVELEQQEK